MGAEKDFSLLGGEWHHAEDWSWQGMEGLPEFAAQHTPGRKTGRVVGRAALCILWRPYIEYAAH